jgi:hypothetical protein
MEKRSFAFAYKFSIYSDRVLHVYTSEDVEISSRLGHEPKEEHSPLQLESSLNKRRPITRSSKEGKFVDQKVGVKPLIICICSRLSERALLDGGLPFFRKDVFQPVRLSAFSGRVLHYLDSGLRFQYPCQRLDRDCSMT